MWGCQHLSTRAWQTRELGVAVRCEDCGLTRWEDPPDLAARIDAWVSEHPEPRE